MIQIIADEKRLLKDLRLFVDPVEITDSEGKLLGLFVPGNLERGKQSKERAIASFDPAELKRRAQDPNRSESTLRQGIELIEQLDAEMKRRKAVGEMEFTKAEALEYFTLLQRKAVGTNVPSETSPCPSR